jgi:hypothetical protein
MKKNNTLLRARLWLVAVLPVVSAAVAFSDCGKGGLFPEDSFLRGFRASPVQIAQEIPLSEFNQLRACAGSGLEPFWDVALWNCAESLSGSNCLASGQMRSAWSNEFVSLSLSAPIHAAPQLALSLDSLAIYNRLQLTYKQMEVIRPHFLLSHNFYPDALDGMKRYGKAALPSMAESSIPDLNTLQSLDLELKATMIEMEPLHESYAGDEVANWDKLKNRSGFTAHFIVYCRDPSSASCGKWFWLGFLIYDSNLPYPGAIHYETDQLGSDGNGNYAYLLRWGSLYGTNYLQTIDSFNAGEETSIKLDVLSAVRKALLAMQEEGAFMDVPADLSGLTISHFNIGWEVKAPMRGTISLQKLNLRCTEKSDE